ncbi:helix-turn-helix domain-containing protein [Empedobacter brevis]|uniref:helix-turn-helix domain-containing protein n=1 Tax=Empedobacter brevis TaxID=247 RepID=UPI0028A19DB5|nr:helix-turn-helix domain-containing protein [Empedobacter brevis]
MDREIQIKQPDYKQIFLDILEKKYPTKKEKCWPILNQDCLSVLDIIRLNKIIFDTDKENEEFNQKHRSYNKSTILKILDYQKKYNLNNSQLAHHFNLSRNTVAKWKKMFLI